MTAQVQRHHRLDDPTTDRAVRRAWLAVALILPAFGVAFAVGEALYSAFGHDPGTGPWPVELFVTAVVLVIALVPCVAAADYGRRAGRAGDRRGRMPAAIGALVGVAEIVMTLVTEIGDLVRR